MGKIMAAKLKVLGYSTLETLPGGLHRKRGRAFQTIRQKAENSHCCRMERSSFWAGVAPAEVQRLSRRTVTPIDRLAASSMPLAVAFSVAPSDLGRG
jgi:hypothetical protein